MVIVDADWRQTAPDGQPVTVAENGIRLRCDVATLIDDATGSIEAHYRLALAPTVLVQLPGAMSMPVTNAGPGLLNRWKENWSR